MTQAAAVSIRRALVVAAVAACTAGLVGCGSNEPSTPAPTAGISGESSSAPSSMGPSTAVSSTAVSSTAVSSTAVPSTAASSSPTALPTAAASPVVPTSTARSVTGTPAATTPAPPAPPTGDVSAPSSALAGGTVSQLRGTLEAGVESGCVVLTDSSGAVLANLIGVDTATTPLGSSVVVTGKFRADLMTTCQQGKPFAVASIELP